MSKKLPFASFDPLEKHYRMLGEIGSGAYGVVTKAECVRHPSSSSSSRSSSSDDKKSKEAPKYVAVKEVKIQSRAGVPPDAYREIKILKELEHPHIVTLERVFLSPTAASGPSLSLVYDYAEHDLAQLIHYHKKGQPFPQRVLKSLLKQMLLGIQFLHQNWIMHRDMKPANVLVMGTNTPEPGRVRIGDFGLARIFQSLHEVRRLERDGDVVTIWYRAPELLLGSSHYTPAIDMWAVGCIFAEMVLRKPLFSCTEPKDRQIKFHVEQIKKVFSIMGFPSTKDWPLFKHCKYWDRVQAWDNKAEYQNRLRSMFTVYKAPHQTATSGPPMLPEAGFDLLCSMLEYDPEKRITADKAVEHPYFAVPPVPHKTNAFQLGNQAQVIEYPKRNVEPMSAAAGANATAGKRGIQQTKQAQPPPPSKRVKTMAKPTA